MRLFGIVELRDDADDAGTRAFGANHARFELRELIALSRVMAHRDLLEQAADVVAAFEAGTLTRADARTQLGALQTTWKQREGIP